jgi:catechol 2,3-dioxygenase-like lactoylglutathione lyase family enzyme
VLGHLGVNVPDLGAAKAYYDRLLPTLGFEPFVSGLDQFAYRPAGGRPGTYLFFYAAVDTRAYSREASGLQHLAFRARTRAEVRAAHRLAVELGAEVVHPPRHFPEYPPPYYATFWLDPHGFLLEVVCHTDRDEPPNAGGDDERVTGIEPA